MPIDIDYYSDVLCVWAWIAQRRLDELSKDFGDSISIKPRFVNVFANTRVRIGEQWSSKGGYEGFARHVIDSAAAFPDAPVNEEIWHTIRPASSMPAHTVIKAVELSHSAQAAQDFAATVRKQFFTNLVDVGRLDVLLQLASANSLSVDSVNEALNSGAAVAEVLSDYQSAQQQGVKGSPSWVLDNGRQVLYGNVGYRVIRANAVELLNQPVDEASWC